MRIARQVAATVVAAVAFAGVANAQETHFAGTTTGCFTTGTSCAYSTDTGIGSTGGTLGFSDNVLEFNSGSFSNTTVGGFLAIGGTTTQNLGLVTLRSDFDCSFFQFSGCGAGTDNFNPENFFLKVTFSDPNTIGGGQNSFFTADLSGTVSGNNGGVNFDFDNTVQTFSYAGGTFTFHVNDLSLTPGQVLGISGVIQTTTPEPSSMALLGTGLIGLVPMFRRRKSA